MASDRYPLIVEAALRHRSTSFVMDGEAVLLAVDGISDFDGLHARMQNDEVQFYAFEWRGFAVAAATSSKEQPLSHGWRVV
jgi:ATP-dependent DNA ligase